MVPMMNDNRCSHQNFLICALILLCFGGGAPRYSADETFSKVWVLYSPYLPLLDMMDDCEVLGVRVLDLVEVV